MIRKQFCVMAFFLLFGSVACTHLHNPAPYPVKKGTVMSIAGAGADAVALINDQAKHDLVFLGNMGAHKYLGDFHVWTETAISVMGQELARMGIRIDPTAEKQIRLAVTDSNIYQGFWAVRCIMKLRVSTPEGYSVVFEGNNPSPASLHRATAGAVTRAVTAALNDSQLRAYLGR